MKANSAQTLQLYGYTIVLMGGLYVCPIVYVSGDCDLTFLVVVGRPFGGESWAAVGAGSPCESGGRGEKQGCQIAPSHGRMQHDTVVRS